MSLVIDLACCMDGSSAQTTGASVSCKVMEIHDNRALLYSNEAYQALAAITITEYYSKEMCPRSALMPWCSGDS